MHKGLPTNEMRRNDDAMKNKCLYHKKFKKMNIVIGISPYVVTNEIIGLFEKWGDEDYDGEPVSQASHMIQAAMQAIEAKANDELVIGAFLHDVGHLLKHEQQTEEMGIWCCKS